MINTASKDDWDEVAVPICLAISPIKPKDFIALTGITLFEEEEDGLGPWLFNLVNLNGNICLLNAYPEGPDLAAFIAINVLSYQESWDGILDSLSKALKFKQEDYLWKQTALVPGRFELVHIKSGSDELILHRFPNDEFAEMAMATYQKRMPNEKFIVRPSASK